MNSPVIEVEGTEERVCQDIASRQKVGKEKYGTTVAENPLALREWLQHAYEETLDQAIYLRRAIEELDSDKCEIIHEFDDDDNTPVVKGDPFSNPNVDNEGIPYDRNTDT